MRLKPCSYFFLLILLFASCEEKVQPNSAAVQEPERQYVINPAGDSIPTGVPIPIKGKRLDLDNITEPKVIPWQKEQNFLSPASNRFPVGTPRVVALSSELKVITPGDDDGFHILAVDDDPVNQQVLSNYLSGEGYQLTQAMNGKEALAALAGGRHFDVVLLDIMMPGMSGYEVCQRIRDTYLPSELPILMITAKNQASDLVEALSSRF